jgi:hypothetical protein
MISVHFQGLATGRLRYLGILMRALCRMNSSIVKPCGGVTMISEQHADDKMPVVNVYYKDNCVGVYKAKLIGEFSILLRHGAISFPVGTALKVKFRRLAERRFIRKPIKCIVRNNSSKGMLLRFQSMA